MIMHRSLIDQTDTLALANRAHASVSSDAAAFSQAEAIAQEGLDRIGVQSGAEAPPHASSTADESPAPPPPPSLTSEPPPASAALSAMAEAEGAGPLATSPLIGELQWLRLGTAVREGASLEEVNQFWSLLRSLYVRRETKSLQAAQLLALGVRMSDENARRMRILQALGLIKLANNAVHFLADPA